MSANPARKTDTRLESPATTPTKKWATSKRIKTQMQTLFAVCCSLFFLWMGVMFYLVGNANIEFERQRHSMLVNHLKDAEIERNVMRDKKNVETSAFSVEKKVSLPNTPEHLVPADETKAITL